MIKTFLSALVVLVSHFLVAQVPAEMWFYRADSKLFDLPPSLKP